MKRRNSISSFSEVAAIVVAFLTALDGYAQGVLTIRAGESYTYQFNTLAFAGPWDARIPPGAPAALVTGGLGSYQPSTVVLFEIFEKTTDEPAAASQTVVAEVDGPYAVFWAWGSWQDLQGALRVSVLNGWATFDYLNATAIRDDAGILNSYAASALPVPEPSSFVLFTAGTLLTQAFSRLRIGPKKE